MLNSHKQIKEKTIYLIGDELAGLSSLMYRETDDVFHELHIRDYCDLPKVRTYSIPGTEIECRVTYRDLTVYTRATGVTRLDRIRWPHGAKDAFIYVLDLTRSPEESIPNCGLHLEDIKRRLSFYDKSDVPHLILVGTKADLIADRKISSADIQKLIEQHGFAAYIETSAKNNVGFEDLPRAFAQIFFAGPVVEKDSLDALSYPLYEQCVDDYNKAFSRFFSKALKEKLSPEKIEQDNGVHAALYQYARALALLQLSNHTFDLFAKVREILLSIFKIVNHETMIARVEIDFARFIKGEFKNSSSTPKMPIFDFVAGYLTVLKSDIKKNTLDEKQIPYLEAMLDKLTKTLTDEHVKVNRAVTIGELYPEPKARMPMIDYVPAKKAEVNLPVQENRLTNKTTTTTTTTTTTNTAVQSDSPIPAIDNLAGSPPKLSHSSTGFFANLAHAEREPQAQPIPEPVPEKRVEAYAINNHGSIADRIANFTTNHQAQWDAYVAALGSEEEAINVLGELPKNFICELSDCIMDAPCVYVPINDEDTGYIHEKSYMELMIENGGTLSNASGVEVSKKGIPMKPIEGQICEFMKNLAQKFAAHQADKLHTEQQPRP